MERKRPVVSPAVLQRALSGFKFDPSVVESANFEDYVEGPVLVERATGTEEAIMKIEDGEHDRLLLEASQQFEASQQQQFVARVSSRLDEGDVIELQELDSCSSACSTGWFGVPFSPMDVKSVKQSRVPKKTQGNTSWALNLWRQ